MTYPPMECSISAPPTIEFGHVNITGVPENGLLATQKQGIDITCSSEDARSFTDKMDISFEGAYQGGYWGRLSFTKNNSGAIMGYIRGRYLDAGGSCAGDKENEVSFDGRNGIKTIKNVGVGLVNIPIIWSLCSNDSGLLGEGSAKATVNVNWN